MKNFRACSFASLAIFAAALILGSGRLSGQSDAPGTAPKPAAAKGNAENGKLLFMKDGCYECHGREGQGASYTGPRIGPDVIPFSLFSSYIRKPSAEMPPYTAKVLSDEDLADIYAFLQSRPKPPDPKDLPLPK